MGALGRRWTLIVFVLTVSLVTMNLHLNVTSSARLTSAAHSDGPVSFDGDHFGFLRLEGSGRGEDDDPGDREPYVDRWRRRFASRSGFVFFKHIRKAAGSMIRQFIFRAFEHHGQGTFEQFLNNNDRKEVKRHFPFLNSEQIQLAKGYFNNGTKGEERAGPIHRVYYIEQEFSTMDWQCRDVDPRWNDTLSVIVMRHPIERHLSEFFYSGPPATDEFEGIKFQGPRHGIRLEIDRAKLYANKTYTHLLSMFIQRHLQPWAVNDETEEMSDSKYFQWYLGQRYVDNFQLRSLSGCAAEQCPGVHHDQMQQIVRDHHRFKNATSAAPIDSPCTMHPFYTPEGYHPYRGTGGIGLGACRKGRKECPGECEGPCLHRAAAWGPVGPERLPRARRALGGFDVVLVAETLDDPDQRALLADVMGVPRNASRSLARANVNMDKRTRRERTHFYRDLMSNLTYPFLLNFLVEENALEIELYKYAVQLNRRMTEEWKREVQWSDDDGDGGDTDVSLSKDTQRRYDSER